jgi:hypothetical protein
MKIKIKIPVYVKQALGLDINKQLEVWSSITKNKKKIQNFSSCEPSLGLRYQQTAWGLKSNYKEWKKIPKFQLIWAKPWALISTNSLRFEVQSQRIKKKSKFQLMWAILGLRYQQTAWGLKFNHKEWKKKIQNHQLMWAKPWAPISTNSLRFEVQSQRMKEKIKISAHVSQALGSDLKVSATRPSQIEVWSSITKTEEKIQNFNSCEPSLGLWYQQTA